MKRDISDVLDNCIAEMRRGKSLNDCLADYPDFADELQPLLRTVQAVRTSPRVEATRPVVDAGKARFLKQAADLRDGRASGSNPWQRLSLVANSAFPMLRPRLWSPVLSTALALILILFVAGAGIVSAGQSLPNEPLYPVKLATERVQGVVIVNPAARADYSLALAERRVDEVNQLSRLGRPVTAPDIARLSGETVQALKTIGQVEADAMRPRLERYLAIVAKEQAALSSVLNTVAPSVEPVVAIALATSVSNEKLAATALIDPKVIKTIDRPGLHTLPPGLLDSTPTAAPSPAPSFIHTPTPYTAAPAPATPSAAGTPTAPAAQPVVPPVLPPVSTPTATASPAVATATPTATPTPTLAQIHIVGRITSMSAAEWVIDATPVRVSERTLVAGAQAAQVGARVDVLAQVQPDRTLLALSITVLAPPEVAPEPIRLRGVIQSVGRETWRISGRLVSVDAGTVISGTPTVGHIAEVTALHQPGDTLLATIIDVRPPSGVTTFQGRIESMSATTWVISGRSLQILEGVTTISGMPSAGAPASVTVLRLDDTLVALQITIIAASQEEEFEGVITDLADTVWQIGGRRVLIDANTQVDESLARAQRGRRARVRGWLQNDASVLASRIVILAPGGSDKGRTPTPGLTRTPAPPASPTATRQPPTATPTPEATATPRLEPTPSPTPNAMATVRATITPPPRPRK